MSVIHKFNLTGKIQSIVRFLKKGPLLLPIPSLTNGSPSTPRRACPPTSVCMPVVWGMWGLYLPVYAHPSVRLSASHGSTGASCLLPPRRCVLESRGGALRGLPIRLPRVESWLWGPHPPLRGPVPCCRAPRLLAAAPRFYQG